MPQFQEMVYSKEAKLEKLYIPVVGASVTVPF